MSIVPKEFAQWDEEDRLEWVVAQLRVVDPWTLYGELRRFLHVRCRMSIDQARYLAARYLDDASEAVRDGIASSPIGVALIAQRLLEAADLAKRKGNPSAMVRAMAALTELRNSESVRIAAVQLLNGLRQMLPAETFQEVYSALLRVAGDDVAQRKGKRGKPRNERPKDASELLLPKFEG